jgi:hypothetical protein
MHQDAIDQTTASSPELWAQYIVKLRDSGLFDGGSSIGDGERLRKGATDAPAVGGLS